MTEQDIRRIVLDAVPPLPQPPDRLASVLRRARQQRLHRTSVTAAFAVTLAAAASGLVFAMPGGSPLGVASSGSPAAPAPSPAAIVSASAVPSDHASPPPAVPRTLEERLAAASRGALRRAAPGAQLAGDLRFQESFGGNGEFGAIQLVTAAGRTGTITVVARRGNGKETCASEVAASCTQSTGPDGERILSVPATGDGSSNGKQNRALVVIVVRPAEKLLVMVIVDNATEITKFPSDTEYGMESTGYTGQLPPLTLTQARKAALEVAAKTELS